jgi:hypothetical protein
MWEQRLLELYRRLMKLRCGAREYQDDADNQNDLSPILHPLPPTLS